MYYRSYAWRRRLVCNRCGVLTVSFTEENGVLDARIKSEIRLTCLMANQWLIFYAAGLLNRLTG